MQANLNPDLVYFYCHAPFDTGIIFPPGKLSRSTEMPSKTAVKAANRLGKNWQPDNTINISTLDHNTYISPFKLGFLKNNILNELKSLEFNVPDSENNNIQCSIDKAIVYIHHFRTGVLSLRVQLPRDTWLDIEKLISLRRFFMIASNIHPIFYENICDLRDYVKNKLSDMAAPEFDSTRFHFDTPADPKEIFYWSHGILVCLSPKQEVMKTANYLTRILRLDNPGDLTNFVPSRLNTFIYTAAGNSLICIPKESGDEVAYSWVRLVEIQNHVYKTVWDLDHMLYTELTNISFTAKSTSGRGLAESRKEIDELKRLSIHLESLLDYFHPRHVTTDFGLMHYIDQLRDRWQMGNLIEDVRKKFNLVDELNQYIFQSVQEQRDRRFNGILVVLTLLTLISVINDGWDLSSKIQNAEPETLLIAALLIGSVVLLFLLLFLLFRQATRSKD